jgi:type 1 glutamine amidotransferase
MPMSLGWTPARQKKRILMLTKASAFEHSVIKRQGEKLGHAERILTELGDKHGFEVTCTKDGSVFTADRIRMFDAFFFYTSGDLTRPGNDGNPAMSPGGKAAFLQAIREGKGFIGSHCATDTFHTQPDPPDRSNRYFKHGEKADPYVRMIGAEFIKHGPQQVGRMTAADHGFPGMKAAGDGFELMEEWYSLKDFSPDLHVLLVQETKGMKGADYQRAPYPATWARMHGRGRVFYTSMGHREDVWTNPLFQSILLGGISWALRNVDADVSPNLESAAPGHHEIPPKGP